MNPNAGEPVNPGGGVFVADKPVSPVGQSPIGVAPPQTLSPDISRVEDLVKAAQEAVVAQTPKGQFENQFGSGVGTSSPASESAPDLMAAALEGLGTPPSGENSTNVPVAPLDSTINTVGNLLEKVSQVAESESEVRLPPNVQEFLDSVLNASDKYKASEEVTK